MLRLRVNHRPWLKDRHAAKPACQTVEQPSELHRLLTCPERG
jgi:hypothetical protein